VVTGYEEDEGAPVSPTHASSSSLPPPPPQSERSEAAGSDRRDEFLPQPPPSSAGTIHFLPVGVSIRNTKIWSDEFICRTTQN
jgi:hypothetical protein